MMEEGSGAGRREPRGREAEGKVPTDKPAPPVAWGRILFAYGVAALCGLAALGLAAYFLHTRPLDLVPASNQVHAELERALIAHGLPPDSVTPLSVERQTDERAYWDYAVYEAEAPQALNMDDLRYYLIRELTVRDIAVYEEAGEAPEETILRLSFGGREVALARLQSAAPPEPDPRRDSPCADLAAATADALSQTEAPLRLTGRHDPPPELLAEEDCAPHVFEGVLEEDMDTALLIEHLAETLAPFGARVYGVSHGHPLTVSIMAMRDGCECIRIELEPSPELREQLDTGVVPEPSAPDDTPPEAEAYVEPAPEADRRDPDGPIYAAIIVDDGGYGGSRTEAILQLDAPLTLAILPYTPEARSLAERAAERGFEVMLHMPMQANDENVHYPNELRVDMKSEEVARYIEEALAETPGAKGINNHMGSRFTSDPEAMHRLFAALEDTNYYFVDSMTTPDSVAHKLASELGIPTARRHVFLDHDPEPEKIREAFEHFIDRCKRQGQAIAIGHFHTPFADMAGELLERLEEEGVTLAHVSELVR